MLDLILPNFQTRFRTDRNEETIAEVLREENERILDPAHLEADVIGHGEFEWDFRCLRPGFRDLVAPFTRVTSGGSHLLLLALDELGVTRDERLSLIPIVEYPHFASLVNDHYNFHPELNRPKPDRFTAAKLTQLKYAAQFMVVYPKYLVLRNRMAADLATRNRLHAAMFQLTAMVGTSRALYLDWSRRSFAGVTRENGLQWGIYTLASYFLGPVKLACILAGVPESKVNQMRTAFSWLAVAAKLELDRRVLDGETTSPQEPERQPSFRVESFPAVEWIEYLEKSGGPPRHHNRFPDFTRCHEAAITDLRQSGKGPRLRNLLVDEALEKFSSLMVAAELLPDLTNRLMDAFQNEGGTR